MKRLILGMIIWGSSSILAQNSITCFKKAYSSSGLNLSTQNTIELCAGAVNLNAITCFKKAHSSSGLNLGTQNAIKLCKSNRVQR